MPFRVPAKLLGSFIFGDLNFTNDGPCSFIVLGPPGSFQTKGQAPFENKGFGERGGVCDTFLFFFWNSCKLDGCWISLTVLITYPFLFHISLSLCFIFWDIPLTVL